MSDADIQAMLDALPARQLNLTPRIVKFREPRSWRARRLQNYNGFIHEERVRGWQVVRWLQDTGFLQLPLQCEICKHAGTVPHSEDYYHPLRVTALCKSCHSTLHRRFRNPESWQRLVETYSKTGAEWFALLPLEPVDVAAYQRRVFGNRVADPTADLGIPGWSPQLKEPMLEPRPEFERIRPRARHRSRSATLA